MLCVFVLALVDYTQIKMSNFVIFFYKNWQSTLNDNTATKTTTKFIINNATVLEKHFRRKLINTPKLQLAGEIIRISYYGYYDIIKCLHMCLTALLISQFKLLLSSHKIYKVWLGSVNMFTVINVVLISCFFNTEEMTKTLPETISAT